MQHKLVDGTLKREGAGITARCECGWVSGGHFTSLGASAAFQEHKETCGNDDPSGDDYADRAEWKARR